MGNSRFFALHPYAAVLYFLIVIGVAVTIMHPVFLVIGLFGIFLYGAISGGVRTLLRQCLVAVPMLVLLSVFTVLFSHRGATILYYFPSGNPLTLESIFFAVSASALFVCVVLWFSGAAKVLDSDKVIFITGRAVPYFGLFLSMVLRFVPLYIAQYKRVRMARNALFGKAQSFWQRIKNEAACFSVLLSWAFENGIVTAQSMSARGFGLRGRTSYVPYRFSVFDTLFLCVTLALAAVLLCMLGLGAGYVSFYPFFEYSRGNVLAYICYFLLCVLPSIADAWEALRWKQLQSKI